jgi:hypothetical protein
MMTNRNEVLETLKKVTRNYAGKAVTAAELALFLDDTKMEDSQDHPTINELIENDLEMLNQGFEFEIGELDWYLDKPEVFLSNKRRLLAFKRIGKV